jgi:hypothetical protein
VNVRDSVVVTAGAATRSGVAGFGFDGLFVVAVWRATAGAVRPNAVG